MMSNLLQQLENNEAILLMYLAGELPEPDRVEVEQMLVNDPSLRAAMAEMAALQSDVSHLIAGADAGAKATARQESAIRRTVRALAAVQEDARAASSSSPLALANAASAAEPGRRFHVAWWAYPVAAAAVLLVGIMLLSNTRPAALPPSPEINNQIARMDNMPAPRILEVPQDDALERLDQVEREVLALRNDEIDLAELESPDPDR